jgi:hypothetical protein
LSREAPVRCALGAIPRALSFPWRGLFIGRLKAPTSPRAIAEGGLVSVSGRRPRRAADPAFVEQAVEALGRL